MLKTKFLPIALIGAGLLGFTALPASAVTLPVKQTTATTDSATSLAVPVAERRVIRLGRDNRNRVQRYDRRRHGPRCRTAFGNCRHYYGGYYYSSPWWTLPLVGTGIVIGSTLGRPSYRTYGSRHVRWCRNQYRSYNVRTNTWLSYSGVVRQCRSPYS